jgi:hypothetical protein
MTDSGARPPLGRLAGDVLPSLVAGCGIAGDQAADIVARFAASVPPYPSTSEAADLLRALVGLCADDKHPFAYLSVPVTTGRAYLELYAENGQEPDAARRSQDAREAARSDNERRAYAAAKRLRMILAGTVIDPSRLADVPGWAQADYHAFWISVIDEYAEKAYFLDGWNYSVGCTTEFACAVELGLPTFTEHLGPLSMSSGRRLIETAIDEYVEAGLDPELLRRSLVAAEKAAANTQSRSEMLSRWRRRRTRGWPASRRGSTSRSS